MQVGIRDLKNKLKHYLEIAKSGHAVIIIDRGAPVAVLHNLDQIEENAGYEERLASDVSFVNQGKAEFFHNLFPWKNANSLLSCVTRSGTGTPLNY